MCPDGRDGRKISDVQMVGMAGTFPLVRSLLAVAAAAAVGSAVAAGQSERVGADLIAPVVEIRAGEPFRVGLRQRIAADWHTYWINPGDSGEPTKIAWQLPEGFATSEIAWPVPEAIPVGPLMNYGYSGEVLLPVTITPPATLTPGPITLTAEVDLLVCRDICIPEQKTVSLTLEVKTGDGPLRASEHGDRFALSERMAPTAAPWPMALSVSQTELMLSVTAPDLDPQRISSARFFADKWGIVEHAAPQPASWSEGVLTLTLARGEMAGQPLGALTGLLVLSESLGAETVGNGFTVDVPAVTASPRPAASQLADGPTSVWHAALLAVLGGLVLNLMPCVFPILSLKVIALARERGVSGAAARMSGASAYLAGVLSSFAFLAGIAIALRGAGEMIGWGFQFQSPLFVLGMAALFLALGLSMSGVFDVGVGLVGSGDGLARKGGHAGSFFTGILATIAATPCTAPFMGAAVGFALTRPPIETFAVMMALGLGFALPLVVLSVSGAARRMLPPPGPWMETLKQLLAFPLYATVAWLVWVLSVQAGSDGVLAAAFVLTGVALAAWIVGRSAASSVLRAGAAAIVGGVALAIALPLLGTNAAVRPTASEDGELATAEVFSQERVTELRRSGHNVFVNLTAAWCITCKVNERIALDTDGVREALARSGTVYLKGDWTRRDDAITRLLEAHGRAGVPLYLLYPAVPEAEAVVLPQLLTEAIVVSHIAALPPVGPARRTQ